MLGVDERAHAAELLRLGEHVVDQRRLARGLRTEDLDDAPPRHTPDAEREIERQRARGDRVAAHLRALVAHPHDGALPELALDLRERPLKGGIARLGSLLLVGNGHGLTPPVEDGSNKLEDAPDGTFVRIVRATV